MTGSTLDEVGFVHTIDIVLGLLVPIHIVQIEWATSFTIPMRKGAHGQCTLHWAKIGGWADV